MTPEELVDLFVDNVRAAKQTTRLILAMANAVQKLSPRSYREVTILVGKLQEVMAKNATFRLLFDKDLEALTEVLRTKKPDTTASA